VQVNTKVGIAFIAGVLAAVAVFYATSQRSSAPPEIPVAAPVAQVAPAQIAEPIAEIAPAALPQPIPASPAPKPRSALARIKTVPAAPATDSEPVQVPAPEPPAAPPAPSEPVVETPAPPQQAVVDPPPPPRLPKPAPAPQTRQPGTVTIVTGTELQIRLGEPLSSERHKTDDTFVGTLDQPLVADGFVIAERGSRVEGRVAEAVDAGRVKGLARLVLELTHIHTSDHQRIPIRTARYERQGDRAVKEDLGKVAVGAAIGAAIGAAADGGKGAGIGAAAGAAAGAGAAAISKGTPATLNAEARITFRLDQPVTITEQL